jgi:hypothetical protein
MMLRGPVGLSGEECPESRDGLGLDATPPLFAFLVRAIRKCPFCGF